MKLKCSQLAAKAFASIISQDDNISPKLRLAFLNVCNTLSNEFKPERVNAHKKKSIKCDKTSIIVTQKGQINRVGYWGT